MIKEISTKWIAEIILVFAISVLYYLNLPVKSAKVIFVPQGSISEIITHLQRKRIDVNYIDTFFLRIIGYPQSGWIDIGTTKLTKADFLYKLTTAKAALVDITLIPGETTYIFLNQLAQKLRLDRARLEYYYDYYSPIKEGAFVPDTYKLPRGIGEKKAIKLLLYRSRERMKKWSHKIFGTFNEKKWFHFVTLASIIQKESASIEDMPTVSSVIYNRLKKGMKLQMDGSLNYGKYSHIAVSSKRIKEDNSSYNTYKIKGLPPQPVCNVSLEAIKAAIFPAKSDYLYFVRGKNGKHIYTRYYSTHIKNIKRGRNATK